MNSDETNPARIIASEKQKINSKERFEKTKNTYRQKYGDILIDDTQRVLDYFLTAGGEGVLHTSANETISKLNEMVWE